MNHHVQEACLARELSELRAERNALLRATRRLGGDVRRLRRERDALARERDEARICPVTELPTRRAWEEAARQVLRAGPAVVLLADLDRFKQVNDTWGHQAGDAVLRAVAARLRAASEGCAGVAGRLGGDEFALAASARGWDGARVERLRGALCLPVPYEGVELVVGATIGMARTSAGEGGLSQALGEADAQMYARKGRGRRGRVPASGGDARER
jgi:diguanylate cyclase (GGDEF)-like protein